METQTYTTAVDMMARNLGEMSLFDASSLLASMYCKTKEETIEDLLKVRKLMLRRGEL